MASNLRASRLVRGARRAPAIALLIALATGCQSVGTTVGSPAPSASPTAAPGTVVDQKACERPAVRESCAALRVDGDVVRYALYRASSPTARTVLVDVGGPGVSALSGLYGLYALQSSLPQLRGINVLALEERWPTAVPDAACTTALSGSYVAARAGRPNAAALRSSCSLDSDRWARTPEQTASAVSAVVDHEGLELEGFLGFSFGSQHWQDLGSTSLAHAFRWSVLTHPFPVGASGDELVRERAAVTERRFSDLTVRLHDLDPATRSVPVNAFDVASARLALGLLPRSETVPAVERGSALEISRLSDQLWLRYGTTQLSPGYLAQLSEVCRVLHPTHGVRRHGAAAVLAMLYAPCTTPVRPVPAVRPASCVVEARRDSVVPYSLVSRAYPDRADQHVVMSSDAAHTSRDGLGTCLARVIGT